MKKIFSIGFIIYLFFSTPVIFVCAVDDFVIVDGKSFVYDVITSKIDVAVNRIDLSVDAFQFGGYQFPSNNSVEIDVTFVQFHYLNYSIYCDWY